MMWTLVFTVIGLVVTCVSGNDCDVSHVSPCFNSVTNYEGLAFPLYGQDEVELDNTCKKINESYECLLSYVEICKNQPECDEKCVEMIQDIGTFTLHTGLVNLESELCNPESHMRKSYLENYVCLDDSAQKYAACHNDSKKSQIFMDSLKTDEEVEAVERRCCYLSWFQACFINATEACGRGAHEYVSFGLYSLVGQVEERLCKNNPVQCEKPPLPAEDEEDNKPSLPGGDLDEDKSKTSDKHVGKSATNSSYNTSLYLMFTCQVVTFWFCVISLKQLFQ